MIFIFLLAARIFLNELEVPLPLYANDTNKMLIASRTFVIKMFLFAKLHTSAHLKVVATTANRKRTGVRKNH